MVISPKLRHDFLNNCLRLEVLNRLLAESMEKDMELDSEHLEDLEVFLNDHLNFLKEIKT